MDTNNLIYKIILFKRRISWWQTVLILAAAAFAFYGYLFLARTNFSASNVILSVEGPENFKAQEKVEFEVKVENKSRFELENAYIYVTLPEFLSFEDGSRGEKMLELESVRNKEEISKKINVFANETQREGTIKVRAEYTPKNLSGTFESTANIRVAIASLPLTVIFDLPQKAVNGQQLRGTFHFLAEKELESLPLAVRIMLPEDFSLHDAEPKPQDTTTWIFEKVEPKKSYAVEFEGVIRGAENEAKNFDLLFGTLNKEGVFSQQYKASRKVRISSAPLEFSQTVNGSAGSPQGGVSEYIASPGEKLSFRIDYKNKSGVDIENASITTTLEGSAFDLATLDAGLGYFNANTKTIIWDKNFIPELSRLAKEASGSVEFSVSLKTDLSPKSYRDKNILLKSRAVMDSPNLPLALKGLSLRAESISRVKVRTFLNISSSAYYYEGPFSNSGPIPPKVAEKTTYTISWQIKNSLNEMSGVRVEAPLSRSVVFEEKTYPFANKLSYDSKTHSVSWDVGGLSWGVGHVFPAETVAFQVSLTPQNAIRGQVAELVGRTKISGQDTFADEFIESFAPSTDTTLPDDVGMRKGDGVVQ